MSIVIGAGAFLFLLMANSGAIDLPFWKKIQVKNVKNDKF